MWLVMKIYFVHENVLIFSKLSRLVLWTVEKWPLKSKILAKFDKVPNLIEVFYRAHIPEIWMVLYVCLKEEKYG